MKTYEELYERVLTRRTEELRRRKRQRRIGIGIAVAGVCICLTAGWFWKKPPTDIVPGGQMVTTVPTQTTQATRPAQGGEPPTDTTARASTPSDRHAGSYETTRGMTGTDSTTTEPARTTTTTRRAETTTVVPQTRLQTDSGESATYVDADPEAAKREALLHKRYAASALDPALRDTVDYDRSEILKMYGDAVGEEYLVIRLATADGDYDVTIQIAHDFIESVQKVK